MKECKLIWYGCRALISIVRSETAPGPRCLHMKRLVRTIHKLTFTISYPLPPCNIKLDASTLSLCKFYVAHGAVVKEPLLTYEPVATTPIEQLFVASPFRASHCKYHDIYCMRNYTLIAAYVVQATCQLQCRSRAQSARKVGFGQLILTQCR